MDEMGMFAALGPAVAGGLGGLFGFVVLGYLFILLDKREDRPSKDDKQVGSKLVLWLLIIAGVVIALMGVNNILAFVLGGFKGGFAVIKGSLVNLVVGAASAAAFLLVFLPRTNNGTHQQAERFAMGTLALIAGLATIGAFYMLVDALVFGRGWRTNIAPALAALATAGATAFFAFFRHGQLSGWTQPVRPAAPMPPAGGYGGGYPPQAGGGGYPPQGGGYPPQGGGYPQQGGGGYPPQGGGYPPQGGGYPPQGGYGR